MKAEGNFGMALSGETLYQLSQNVDYLIEELRWKLLWVFMLILLASVGRKDPVGIGD